MNVYDNNGYQRIFNNYGLHSLARGVNIPDPALGIGSAGNMAPVPFVVPLTQIQKAPKPSQVKTIEQTLVKMQGDPINKGTFSLTPYYGEPIGVN